jgi:hypothetical protein
VQNSLTNKKIQLPIAQKALITTLPLRRHHPGSQFEALTQACSPQFNARPTAIFQEKHNSQTAGRLCTRSDPTDQFVWVSIPCQANSPKKFPPFTKKLPVKNKNNLIVGIAIGAGSR